MSRAHIALLSLLAFLVALPYAALFVLGGVWLWEEGWVLAWIAVATVSSLVGMAIYHRLFRSRDPLPFWKVSPDPEWTAADDRAWKEVQQLAERAGAAPLTTADAERIQTLFVEVLDAAARTRFPNARRPYLETSVPNALAVVELVARDLRAIAETLPGAHMLTIGQLGRLRSSGDKAIAGLDIAYDVYRIARFIFNPVGSLLGEVRDAGTRSTFNWLRADFQLRAQSYAVKLAGKYAIELYSGRIQLRTAEISSYVTEVSRRDMEAANRKQQNLSQERLRVLVLGQVKAGKSSLINALFGEVRAAVGVVPCTRSVEPFLLTRDEGADAIVLDTAGYEDASAVQSLLRDLCQEALRADLILVTLSARNAARAADLMVLEAIDAAFAADPQRHPPPRIAVLTHIDSLRPVNAWNPPYDLTGDDPKAASIRDAIAAVSEDLKLPTETIVPVCLKPGQLYNIEEGLMPLLIQSHPEADRSRIARVLAAYHSETRWSSLWQQAVRSGRLMLSTFNELYRQPPEQDRDPD